MNEGMQVFKGLVDLALCEGCHLTYQQAESKNPDVLAWQQQMLQVNPETEEGISLHAGPVVMHDLLNRHDDVRALELARRFNRHHQIAGVSVQAVLEERLQLLTWATILGRELALAAAPTIHPDIWNLAKSLDQTDDVRGTLVRMLELFRDEQLNYAPGTHEVNSETLEQMIREKQVELNTPACYLPKLREIQQTRPNCIGALEQMSVLFDSLGITWVNTDLIYDSRELAAKGRLASIEKIWRHIEEANLINDHGFADSLEASYKWEQLEGLNHRGFHPSACLFIQGTWWLFDPWISTVSPCPPDMQQAVSTTIRRIKPFKKVLPTLQLTVADFSRVETLLKQWDEITDRGISRSQEIEKFLAQAEDVEHLCQLMADPEMQILEMATSEELPQDPDIRYFIAMHIVNEFRFLFFEEDPLRQIRQRGFTTLALAQIADEQTAAFNLQIPGLEPYHTCFDVVAEPYAEIGISVINSLSIDQRSGGSLASLLGTISPSQCILHNLFGHDTLGKINHWLYRSSEPIEPLARMARRVIERRKYNHPLNVKKIDLMRRHFVWALAMVEEYNKLWKIGGEE